MVSRPTKKTRNDELGGLVPFSAPFFLTIGDIMKSEEIEIIKNEIAPKLFNGELSLFLGAGATIGTPNANNLGVPSSPELIKRIFTEANYPLDELSVTDLQTAFGLGTDDIDNFENFLISNFSVRRPLAWQIKILQH